MSPRRFRLASLLAALPLLLPLTSQAAHETGFIERFALAADREKVLGELAPGSEEYYFFHALHYQNSRNTARLADIMAEWRKRFRDTTPLRESIENREALLTYDADPQKTLQYLKEKFGVEFNYTQEARDKKPDLPSTLAADLVSRTAFERASLYNNPNLAGFTQESLAALVRQKANLQLSQRRALLSRLERPDVPGLVELINADLLAEGSRGFAEFPIHYALTAAQLDALAQLNPDLSKNAKFVQVRLHKMAPSADVNLTEDPAAREAWLDRLWAYAGSLPPTFNTLKAHILRLRLDHDRKKGVYDRDRFLQYVKLPRHAPYLNPRWLEQVATRSHWGDINEDFSGPLQGLRPQLDDEPLMREYFLTLFTRESGGGQNAVTALAPWTDYVKEEWLKPLFAEAMIVSGQGNPERWAPLLTPTAYQQLKDRVDIEFPATNARTILPGSDVTFDVVLKNTPKLLVKVYEINQFNYFQSTGRQLNTDLSLDGLVANAEQVKTYEAGPFVRKRETFAFPELKGRRGAWIIEFIGGGRSSRALVRVGQWQMLQQPHPAGDTLIVLDEKADIVKDAVAWVDGRKLTADSKSGRIVVPFTSQPGAKKVVLTGPEGSFATLATMDHHAEEYLLDAQFHVNREQLLARRQATLAVRPSLMLGSAHLGLELLLEPSLTLTTVTLDGVSTTRELKNVKMDAGGVFTHSFLVPERLAELRVTLNGKVELLSKGGTKQPVTAQQQWSVNGIDRTADVSEGFFTHLPGGHAFDLLGKNGEPLADQQVVFIVKHREFGRTVTVSLRTDEKGRVQLGSLEGVAQVIARCPNGRQSAWQNESYQRTWPNLVQLAAGQPLRLPVPAGLKLEAGQVSLLEKRAGNFAVDISPQTAVRDGFLFLDALPAGDYSLQLRSDQDPVTIDIKAGTGKAIAGWVVGQSRLLEIKGSQMLQIAAVNTDKDLLTVKLANVNPFTRVHIISTRFNDSKDLFESLGSFPRLGAASGFPATLPNLYAAGREIGDEYRYILDRRYAKTYPGNMLTRPGLLLNPWSTRDTGLAELSQAAGQAAGATSGSKDARVRKAMLEAAKKRDQPNQGETTVPNLDFLATSAPSLYNLLPDKEGIVRVPRTALGDRQDVQIYAEDLSQAVSQRMALPEVPTKVGDERLMRPLDPTQPFTEKKEVTVLEKGQKLTLDDIVTSELETYDTLGSVYSLFSTLSQNATLPKFAWILEWPKLNDADKRSRYGEFACHELNFFLARKDPAFFTTVVKPYLAHKKDKTFMDEFLLGADLSKYLEPWRYAMLNTVERALLAQRIPGEAPRAARLLQETWELLPPNPAQLDHLFETALRGRALEMEDESRLAGFKADKAAALNTPMAISALITPAPSPAEAPADSLGSERLKRPGTPAIAADSIDGLISGNGLLGGRANEEMKKQKEERQLYFRQADGEKELAENLGDAQLYFGAEGTTAARGAVRAYFRELGPTKEWAENNYYEIRIAQQDASLIQVNAFWRDFANWVANGSKGAFISPHVTQATRNFSEMMLALAVLDLPFEAPVHAAKTEGRQFQFTAEGPVLVFHKQIKPAGPAANGNPGSQLLVSQSFFRQNDRYRQEAGEKVEKYVTGEFLTGAVYGANVVVTNATSSRVKSEVLLQIPQGALPVLGSKATRAVQLQLEPYTTRTFEYYFYFPTAPAEAGRKFIHYPVNVAVQGTVAGHAAPVEFLVVSKFSIMDKASWDYVSQYGSEADVFTFLQQNNLQSLALERVAWRARQSVDFYRKLTTFLREQHVWNDTLASLSLLHNDAETLRDWLKYRADRFGPYLQSKLVTLDPTDSHVYEHLEYTPLINQRAHRLGNEWRIANPAVLDQYKNLLALLAHKRTLDEPDQLAVVYFLFLQDRVEEALARFKPLEGLAAPTSLQMDYLRCYAALYDGNAGTARQIASNYRDYPVPRWKNLFSEVLSQLDEIDGGIKTRNPVTQPDRELQQGELAATEPGFDFKVEGRAISLNWRNLKKVTVNYYLMDPEFSFSSSPFVSEDASRFSIIKPNLSVETTLPVDKDALDVALPEQYSRANVLVEVVGAGQRKTQAYHANTLKLALTENYGRLEVRDSGSGKALSKAYVKVYARLRNGTVRFFKDGYTDLRGRFDYASLNSDSAQVPAPPVPLAKGSAANGGLDHQMLKPSELDTVDKLAILVLSEANGALVKEVSPPGQ